MGRRKVGGGRGRGRGGRVVSDPDTIQAPLGGEKNGREKEEAGKERKERRVVAHNLTLT